MDSLDEKLTSLVKRVLSREGFDLLDVIRAGHDSSKSLRVIVDCEGGISVNDCARLSRMLSDALDLEGEKYDLGSYRLEVSSPGVDRPLQEIKDFERNVGRDVGVSFDSEGKREYVEGKILSTDNDSVYLQVKEGTVCVDSSSILQAKIKLKWK